MNSRMTLAAVLGLAWVALLTGCAGEAQCGFHRGRPGALSAIKAIAVHLLCL